MSACIILTVAATPSCYDKKLDVAIVASLSQCSVLQDPLLVPLIMVWPLGIILSTKSAPTWHFDCIRIAARTNSSGDDNTPYIDSTALTYTTTIMDLSTVVARKLHHLHTIIHTGCH